MSNDFVSLKKSHEFRQVYRKRISKADNYFVILIKKNNLSYNRVGISVSKKIGNSVVRHRVTRVIREVFRLNWNDILPGHDIVVVARSSSKDSSYGTYEPSIKNLLKLHHLLSE